MGYWEKKSNPVINLNAFTNNITNPLNIIDGGAANSIFEPFDKVKRNCNIYLFDPNPNVVFYESELPSIQIPYALWEHDEGIDLHVAEEESTSSVYPPDITFLSNYPDNIGAPARKTKKIEFIKSITIDSAVSQKICETPDFIKLDVHSSEFEALKGAEKALEGCTGLLVETWHSPIHAGQFLHSDVEAFLNSKGFYLYDIRMASKWKYKSSSGITLNDRGRLIGSESLFFRDAPVDGKVMAYVGLLDLFQYEEAAVRVAKSFLANENKDEILAQIYRNNKMPRDFLYKKVARKILNKLT